MMTMTKFTSKFLRIRDVLSLRAIGKSQHYDDIQKGLFTPPVKIGSRASAWPEHEIASINAARIAGKSDDQIRQLVIELVADRTAGNWNVTGPTVSECGCNAGMCFSDSISEFMTTIRTSGLLPTSDLILNRKTRRVSSKAKANATLDQLTPSRKRSSNLLLKQLGGKK